MQTVPPAIQRDKRLLLPKWMNSAHLCRDMSRLPPFAALRAFEAAARHLSFKEAAAELGLTPTAVSHQIKRLEIDADARLFRRHVRAITLTPAGERFARDIAPALQSLRDAYTVLEGARQLETVVIGAGPIFSSRWLAPRLSDFAATHPAIDLRLHSSQTDFWRRAQDFDIAIAWGLGDWPGVRSTPLLNLTATPLLSPQLADKIGAIKTPRDLSGAPLLHQRDTKAWRKWLSDRRVEMDEANGAVLEDANVALQAALFGQGVMLGYTEFVQDDLNAGRLIQPLDDLTPAPEGYHLIISETQISQSTQAVADWLLSQAQKQAHSTSFG